MRKLIKIVGFASWPTVCGILIAIIILQYQQFEKFNRWIERGDIENILPDSEKSKLLFYNKVTWDSF